MEALQQSRGQASSAAAIVSHPVRARCWYALAEREMCPKELADELRAPLSDVSYHVRVLRDLGVIELVRTEGVRGSVRHYYRGTERLTITREEAADMPAADVLADATTITQLGFADIMHSLETGKLVERPEHTLIRFPMDLDEEAWGKLEVLYRKLLEDLYGLQSESDERRGPESRSIKTTALAFFFERP